MRDFVFSMIGVWLLVVTGTSYILPNVKGLIRKAYFHRENSPVTQTTPEPTLLSWGGWPREPTTPPHPTPHPWPHCKPGLIAFIGPLRPYCSQALWSCSGVSWKKNCPKLADWWQCCGGALQRAAFTASIDMQMTCIKKHDQRILADAVISSASISKSNLKTRTYMSGSISRDMNAQITW